VHYYLAKRISTSLVALVALLIVVFFASRVIGDPTLVLLPPDASESSREAVRDSFGLNDPLHIQLLDFGHRAVFEGFGDSITQGRPALEVFGERLPNTALLALVALLMSMPLAIVLGSIAAVRPKSLVDRIVNVVSLAGISMVDFWLALMLILGFGVWLGWLPVGGSGGLEYLILPALTLAVRTTGRMAQFARSTMIDEYAKPYIKTVRAKGMSERRVFLHALKNAAVPLLTLGGDEFADLAGGAIVVEMVFAYPGVGSLVIQAIESRDLMLIEASIFFLAVLVILINLVVDMAYTYLNPRIELESSAA
jgi:peptide/nickel transport system permease protein